MGKGGDRISLSVEEGSIALGNGVRDPSASPGTGKNRFGILMRLFFSANSPSRCAISKILRTFLPGIALGAFYPALLLAQRGMTSQEFELYSKAKTVVDLPVEELPRAYPALREVQIDMNQEPLAAILQKVGKNVETFFNTFMNTASREHVQRERCRIDGRVVESRKQDFQYLVLANTIAGDILLEEDRTDNHGKPIKSSESQGGLFLTSGFASLPAFLHPMYQPGSRFRYIGKQDSPPVSYVIAFAQNPASPKLLGGTFGAAENSGCMLFQGLVWIDPEIYQIIRMHVELLAPRYDLEIASQTTDMWMSEVLLGPQSRSYWMPREVVVTNEWRSFIYRNLHRYSDYRLFTVESYEKREIPKPQPKPE